MPFKPSPIPVSWRYEKLEKRIKELEEEKEKEEEDLRNDFNAEFEIKLREAEKKLKDKILEEELKLKKREKKLQKRIKELQEYQCEVDNMENVLLNDYPEISDEWRYYEIPDIIKKFKKKIKGLEEDKEEHKKLQGFYDIKKKKLTKSLKKCFHLEEEIRKLKLMKTVIVHRAPEPADPIPRYEKEIKDLKEENEKLKNQNEYLWTPVCAEDYIRLEKQIKDLKRLNAIAEERLSLRKDPLSEKLEKLLRSAGS